jgi:uncharacterized phage protein gp47/JayE
MADTEQLQIPSLDPRNERELVEQALVRVYNTSGGQINDFSSSSVARSLIEGQAFAAAEMLYYLNKLPLALALQFLKIAGVERKLGTRAIASITFTLSASLSTPFTLPQGFQVVDSVGRVSFTTDVQLVIPAGAISGTVTATCEQLGRVGNVPAYRLIRFTQPLAFLASCTNAQPATGGTNEETVDQAIARGLAAIRRRNLVTGDDYEQEAIAVLGEGSVAHAIGLLGGDKVSYELGAVHVFCLNQTGAVPNTAQLNQVPEMLAQKIQIGTSLYVSAIDLLNVDADLTAKLAVGQDPNQAAEQLWAAFQDYLNPTKFKVGESVLLKEVEYALRLTGTIANLQALTLNGLGTNLAMSYRYSLPKAHSLYCQLIDATGNVYRILRGAGESYV